MMELFSYNPIIRSLTRTLSILLFRILVVMARGGNAKSKEIQSFDPALSSGVSQREEDVGIEMVSTR